MTTITIPPTQRAQAINAIYKQLCIALYGPNPPVNETTWKELVRSGITGRCG